MDYVVSEYNESYDRARGLLRQYFIENDYLPEEAFDRTVRKFTDDDFEGYANLNVSYSEDDPQDGIDITQIFQHISLFTFPVVDSAIMKLQSLKMIRSTSSLLGLLIVICLGRAQAEKKLLRMYEEHLKACKRSV